MVPLEIAPANDQMDLLDAGIARAREVGILGDADTP